MSTNIRSQSLLKSWPAAVRGRRSHVNPSAKKKLTRDLFIELGEVVPSEPGRWDPVRQQVVEHVIPARESWVDSRLHIVVPRKDGTFEVRRYATDSQHSLGFFTSRKEAESYRDRADYAASRSPG